MEDVLSKSLDDLIKEQRQKKQRSTTPKRGANKRLKKAPKVVAAGGRRRSSTGPPAQNISITVKGAVGKKRRSDQRRGDQRRPAPRVVDVERQNPELRRAKLEGNDKWGHDMYQQIEGRGSRVAKRDPRAPTTLGPKLFVSNLHFEVSNEDIKELFETCGTLVKYSINFDNAGRSEGTAEVIFNSRSDAERALRRYNNVQLDGKPMEITLIEQATPGNQPVGGRALKSGIKISGGGPAAGATRLFSHAAQAANRVRGRGNIHSGGMDRMQE